MTLISAGGRRERTGDRLQMHPVSVEEWPATVTRPGSASHAFYYSGAQLCP